MNAYAGRANLPAVAAQVGAGIALAALAALAGNLGLAAAGLAAALAGTYAIERRES